jgi:hypothetical protein
MLVFDFMIDHVEIKYRSKFLELMKKWDKCRSTKNIMNAFYDIDILEHKLHEAKKN